MRNLFILILLGMFVCAFSIKQTHVFWYKATTNGYNLQANTGGKGPALPAGCVVHQARLATGGIDQYNSVQMDYAVILGNGASGDLGCSGWFWSQALCSLSGTVDSAKFRAEYRDGWNGEALCQAGPIRISRGVVDYQGNIDFYYGTVDSIPTNTTWRDDANTLNSAMGYDMTHPTLQANDTLLFTALAGRPASGSASVLDGRFLEINVTSQVRWILQNTEVAGNPLGLSGQYAVVLLVNLMDGTTGKLSTYASEAGQRLTGSDAPWTADGNTAHLVVWGDLSPISTEKAPLKAPLTGVALAQNSPNPFMPNTTISYSTDGHKGQLAIYDATGKLIYSVSVSGQGSLEWSAGERAGGIYLCRLMAGNKTVSRKMILMR
jgi:hypothetical protein